MEQIVLGITQGILEWIPVSSEGMIVLIKTLIFGHQGPLSKMISEALFLHLGSVLAATIYFRNDISRLFFALFKKSNDDESTRPLLIFLIIATLISGILGIILLMTLTQIIEHWPTSTQIIALAIGLCLIITGILQLLKKESGSRLTKDLNIKDSILLGIAQGFAALPGLSRSGLTVAALLFRQFGATQAIRISFLMSIPIVLAGNVVMNLGGNDFHPEHLVGLSFSFIFSLLTIDLLLKVARKINFGTFVIIVGVLLTLSVFVS